VERAAESKAVTRRREEVEREREAQTLRMLLLAAVLARRFAR
jgi:hypothetical protein